MAVPSDRNTSVTVVEKLSEYKDLEIEISRMCNMEIEALTVVIFGKKVDKIPGTASINELQKITQKGSVNHVNFPVPGPWFGSGTSETK